MRVGSHAYFDLLDLDNYHMILVSCHDLLNGAGLT